MLQQARYYDVNTGTFISRDPIGFEGGINLYQYARNNPLKYRDPDGLRPAESGRNNTICDATENQIEAYRTYAKEHPLNGGDLDKDAAYYAYADREGKMFVDQKGKNYSREAANAEHYLWAKSHQNITTCHVKGYQALKATGLYNLYDPDASAPGIDQEYFGIKGVMDRSR